MSYNLEGRWNANLTEFQKDTAKEFDWVYLVDSFGYTKFDKKENIIEQISNISPYKKAYCDGEECLVIGTEHSLFENIDRYIVKIDNVISVGIHPSIIEFVNQ